MVLPFPMATEFFSEEQLESIRAQQNVSPEVIPKGYLTDFDPQGAHQELPCPVVFFKDCLLVIPMMQHRENRQTVPQLSAVLGPVQVSNKSFFLQDLLHLSFSLKQGEWGTWSAYPNDVTFIMQEMQAKAKVSNIQSLFKNFIHEIHS